MKSCTKILSRILIVLSVIAVSGCFVNEVKVTGSLAPASLDLPSYINLQNEPTINVKEYDASNVVKDVSSLLIDLKADCSAIDNSSEGLGFVDAGGTVELDGRKLTAVSSMCVEATYAQDKKDLYAQVISMQGMNYAAFFKSCTNTVACENLRIAIFILTDGTNDYGLQLELLSETESSDPNLTLLTLVSDDKVEYYGEVVTSTSISPVSQMTLAIETLSLLDIQGLDISNKDQKALTKDLQEKGATKELEKALKPEYWSDENTLTEKGGDKVFAAVAKAVKKISKAAGLLDEGSSDPSIEALLETLNDLEAILADSMRALAADRIEEATAAKGNESRIATAITQLADGDELVAASKLDKGIKKYSASWNELSGAY